MLDDCVGVGEELYVAVVLSTLGRMPDAVVSEVLGVEGDDVVLTVGDTSGTDTHGDSEWRERVGAGNTDVVDHANQWISGSLVGSGPISSVPCMVVKD